ncbi:GNAT family N-acetyltransferase [Fulvivirgaceae bacterium PWU5]|uniref:GNAT family N-acetyltransferase n=1 Tax=Dawidia cretensis TaxID=2782350 RepID=A0AAP2E0X8_9BACT|nr:GNAT family N-acetyltransferase [Dawidia cretensis]MBT1709597.1 GNAT family N-acetyltransferase [Dawidia cretensis]
MIIREATEGDIPSIVALLKISLGESLMPKSEAYWRWKHQDNPFGASLVMLSCEGDTLVGLRAFMRWQWKADGQLLDAVRPVDTATHPQYQRRGIFSKLTQAALEQSRQRGYHFVYNTPNKSSKPGYLKMGWSEAGKLPIDLRAVRPVSMACNVLSLRRTTPVAGNDHSLAGYLEHPGLEALLKQQDRFHPAQIVTAHTPRSLAWRYRDVPVARYFACGVTRGNTLDALVFYRIKPSKAGNEFRITDVFLSDQADTKQVRRAIAEKVALHRADYVTISGVHARGMVQGLLTGRGMKIGPTVVVRDLGGDTTARLHDFQAWAPSVGDLELF